MRFDARRLRASLLIFSAMQPALADEQCPAYLKLQPITNGEWSVVDAKLAAPPKLRAVSIFSGPPRELRELKPAKIEQIRQGENKILTQEFVFYPSTGRDIYVACRYEATSIILTKLLPTRPERCSVVLRSGPDESNATISCL